MEEQSLNIVRKQIVEKERSLAIRAESILSLVQQQNKERIELQRLIELLEEAQHASFLKDNAF